MDTPKIIYITFGGTFEGIIIIPYGGINSRMTNYLKFFVLIDFPFEDAIFPFNRVTAT